MTFFNSPNFKENLDLKTYNRAYFFQVSESVINECESGFYVNKSGETVELKEKESITLTDFVDHENKISLKKEKSKKKGELDVKFLTTIGAGYELVVEEGYEKTNDKSPCTGDDGSYADQCTTVRNGCRSSTGGRSSDSGNTAGNGNAGSRGRSSCNGTDQRC